MATCLLGVLCGESRAQSVSKTIAGTPDYNWLWGCFGTASGNLAGYWDRNGFPNIYTGTVNGGVAPLTTANSAIHSLWATQAGVDGRPSDKPGHVDNYYGTPHSIFYERTNDPYHAAGRAAHSNDCIGDFIGLSQYRWTNLNGECKGNINGYSFNFFASDGSRRTQYRPPPQNGRPVPDIQSGLRDWMKWRGYRAETFSQLCELHPHAPPGTGFTFEDLVEEIDAGFPLLLFLQNSETSSTKKSVPGVNPTMHGMMAYGYSYTETALRRAQDTSGNSNHGAIAGAEWITNETYYAFDGDDDYIDLPVGAGVDPSVSPFSVSVWVRVAPGSLSANEIFLATYSGSGERLYIGYNAGKWRSGIADTSWTSGGSTQVTTNWTHIALVMDGSEARLYVDGSLDDTKSYASYSLASDIRLGRFPNNNNYDYAGGLGALRLYDRVLGTNEISQLVTAGRETAIDTINTDDLSVFLSMDSEVIDGTMMTDKRVRYRSSWAQGDNKWHDWVAGPWEVNLALRGVIGFHPQHGLSQTSALPAFASTTSWWTVRTTGQTVQAASSLSHNSTNYRFAYWRESGSRLEHTSGEAVNPASGFVMTNPVSVEAVYIPEERDEDADGMEDWWELYYFGSTDCSPGGDDDADNLSNNQERIAGSNPRDANSRFVIDSEGPSDGNPYPFLTWGYEAGRDYTVLWSGPELIDGSFDWQSVSNPAYTVSGSSAKWVDTNAFSGGSGGSRFYRVRVEESP